MINIINFFSDLVFVFCILSVFKFTLDFFKSVFSNPPKTFTLTNIETINYGIALSYIITYIIHLI
jgi:hypothetical protein